MTLVRRILHSVQPNGRLDDEFAEGVSVETDSNDSHSADLVVSSTASAGDVPVKVTLGGKVL